MRACGLFAALVPGARVAVNESVCVCGCVQLSLVCRVVAAARAVLAPCAVRAYAGLCQGCFPLCRLRFAFWVRAAQRAAGTREAPPEGEPVTSFGG